MTHLHAAFSAQDLPQLLLVALAGMIGSGINALAGGGSLVTFPTLLWLGVPSIQANATNAFGMFPGSFTGTIGLRDRFDKTKKDLWPLMLASFIGGAGGAILLGITPAKTFDVLVPFLTAGATLMLALQPSIKAWRERPHVKLPKNFGWFVQLGVSLYGGYFGAGMGIMMLAAFGLFLDGDIHDQNALKNLLAVGINVVAAALFVWKGLIWYPAGLAIMSGALLGGYVAGRLSTKIQSNTLRWGIVVYGTIMTLSLVYKLLT